jgi:hypothetical protein
MDDFEHFVRFDNDQRSLCHSEAIQSDVANDKKLGVHCSSFGAEIMTNELRQKFESLCWNELADLLLDLSNGAL